MNTAQEAWALASVDEGARQRLWSDPASFGKELGLRGAALAELIGGVRFGIRGRDEGAAAQEVLFAATDVENGRASWPFADADDADWARFVSMTEYHTRAVASGKSHGMMPSESTMPRLVSWAEALRDEAIRRADASEEVSVEVADALIAAQVLLRACEEAR